MGFKYWYEGIVFTLVFGVLIIVPCFFIASLGGQMLNEIGNFPTKAAQIQANTFWKVLTIEIVALAALAAFFHIFS